LYFQNASKIIFLSGLSAALLWIFGRLHCMPKIVIIIKGSTEQVLRQAQDERQHIDSVRGELVEP